MARMTDEQRRALVERFMAQVGHLGADGLKNLRREMNLRMAQGRYPLKDLQANFIALVELNKSIKAREQHEAQRERTPDEILKAEAQTLANAHRVSVDVAQRYLMRQRDPLDVARKDRKPAPDPEPAAIQQKYTDERPDLRP